MMQSIREKLLISYLLIVLLFSVSGFLSIRYVAQMEEVATDLVVSHWVTEKLFDTVLYGIDEITHAVKTQTGNFSTESMIASFQAEIDGYIILFEESSLDQAVVDELRLRMRTIQQRLEPAIRSHAQPEIELQKFESVFLQLYNNEAIAGNSELQILLLKYQYEIRSYVHGLPDASLEDIQRRHEQIQNSTIRQTDAKGLADVSAQLVKLVSLVQLHSNAMTDFVVATNKLKGKLIQFNEEFDRDIVKPKARLVDHQFSIILLLIAGTLAVSAFLAILLGIFFSNHLSRPILNALNLVKNVDRGNFSFRLKMRRKDEIGQLADGMDLFVDNLQTALKKLDEEIIERQIVASESAESERKYRKLSHEFQTLLEGITDSIVLISTDNHIVWANRSTRLQIEHPDMNLVGRSLAELDVEYAFAEKICFVKNVLDTGEKQGGVRKSTNGNIYGIRAFPLHDEHGEIVGVIRMSSDVTESYQMRQAAIESGRLASLGELAAGVAHEINNPNALILLNMPVFEEAFAEIVPIVDSYFRDNPNSRIAGMDWEDIKQYFPDMSHEMFEGSKKIQRIVEDLKDYVRQGGTETIFEPFNVNKSIEAALRLMNNQLKYATSNLSLNLSFELPLVFGSPQQIEQVIVNLIQNACQALTDTKQTISVTSCLSAESGKVLISVQDEGKGIAEEHMTHLMEPFFTTRRGEGGTGLGLSISNKILQAHDGSLEFLSVAGEGTTALIALPIANEDSE